MTAWLLGLVPHYGPLLLLACTFCSCLALPIPASMLMLAAGGFVSAGDLSLAVTTLAALAGAVAGDQLGYSVGRWYGANLLDRFGSRAALLRRAATMLATRGGLAVFFSRWLVSALGPYVNVAAGASRQTWLTFTVWAALGEAVWVGLYIGLGDAFTGNLQAASAAAINALGLIAAVAGTFGLGALLVYYARRDRQA